MMHLRPTFPVRPMVASRFALLSLAVALQTTPAHALTVVEGCRTSDSLLVCRLKSILTLLYTAAGILALLLAIAVVAAVIVYRRNSRRLKSKDIIPDAD